MLYISLKIADNMSDRWNKSEVYGKMSCQWKYTYTGFRYVNSFSYAHMNYKSGGKRRNTLGCLDQYTCNMLRLWNSGDSETV